MQPREPEKENVLNPCHCYCFDSGGVSPDGQRPETLKAQSSLDYPQGTSVFCFCLFVCTFIWFFFFLDVTVSKHITDLWGTIAYGSLHEEERCYKGEWAKPLTVRNTCSSREIPIYFTSSPSQPMDPHKHQSGKVLSAYLWKESGILPVPQQPIRRYHAHSF